MPTSRARIEELARAVSVPENVLGAGLVVAVLVQGKGPVLFDAGRAAQSMLLAAWAHGLASCPNGITDRELARTRARARRGRDSGDRPLLRAAGAAARCRSCTRSRNGARGRTASRSTRSCDGCRDADEGRARPRRDEDPGGRDERRVDGARQARDGRPPARAVPRRSSSSSPRRCARRSTTPVSSRWGSPASASARPGSIDVETGTVLQVANIEGWDAPFPLGPTLAAELGRPVPDRERRQRRGRCRASLRCRSRARLVPRRVLGHGRRRWHRDGRPAAHGPWLGRRDRARLLEARRPPLQLRPRGLRRGLRRPLGARGAGPRARQGASDGAVRADGEARPRPAHERRLAARAAGRRRGRRGADRCAPSRRSGSGSARR